MTEVVVGAQGETSRNGTDELWCDALGRVKIRFHWQQAEAKDDRDSCWVRVLNRQAGAGMGWQWLPRIGQEVLIDFMGGDIDRPVLLGALYNGQGEGGIAATPEMLTHLRSVNEGNRQHQWRPEYRNLCVRKVELVHINNRHERGLDGVTARISAHSQVIATHKGAIRHQD